MKVKSDGHAEKGPRGLPSRYLSYAPETNRVLFFDEWETDCVRVKISTYSGAIDSFQRIYLRLEETRTGGTKVSVYQARQAIGVVPWPDLHRVRDWLRTCFDGGLFVVENYDWGDSGLEFDLDLPTSSQLKAGPEAFELLPVIEPENPKKFLFSQSPEYFFEKFIGREPRERLYRRLQLRLTAPKQISIGLADTWSFSKEASKEMLDRLGSRDEITIWTWLTLTPYSSGTELDVLDSFRAPVFDYDRLSFPNWRPVGFWIHADNELDDF